MSIRQEAYLRYLEYSEIPLTRRTNPPVANNETSQQNRDVSITTSQIES